MLRSPVAARCDWSASQISAEDQKPWISIHVRGPVPCSKYSSLTEPAWIIGMRPLLAGGVGCSASVYAWDAPGSVR